MVVLACVSNSFLFFIGCYGILHSTKSALILIIYVEMLLLSVNLNFLIYSFYGDDFYGQTFAIFILTVAAAESALGLAILIVYNRVRGSILIDGQMLLKY